MTRALQSVVSTADAALAQRGETTFPSRRPCLIVQDMRCVVTAGPTYESLDDVRRLTNFSTGRLGSALADFLAARGHQVTLLLGEQAVRRCEWQAQQVETFTTSAILRERLRALAGKAVDAVFHAAAVSDFRFGRIWLRSPAGELSEIKSRKLATRQGTLLAELVPTPKIIAELRGWFPQARLTGWKYEVEGGRPGAIRAAERQLAECLTDACVANGPAYGEGFGLVTGPGCHAHLPETAALFGSLEQWLRA
jgi:phosphopantothenoylcysteine decarboxylase/phosphopantothenate--cysteine ligase